MKENKESVLIKASSAGNLKRVKYLIAARADVNFQDKDGMTALIWANVLGHLDVVKVLIEAKANVDHQDKYGRTALIFASGIYGHFLEIVEALGATDANAHYQEKKYDLQTMTNKYKKGHLKSVKALIKAGANPNLQEQDGMTALMWASDAGNLEIVKALITAGANVDHQDKDGYTALMLASASGYAKDLIKAGDNTKSTAELWFMSKTIKCHLEVVKTLIAAGANPNLRNKDGKTALMWSNLWGHLEIVKLFKNVNHKNVALIEASKEGHLKVVKALITAGADVNYQDEYGKTALDVAKEEGHLEVVEVLNLAMQQANRQKSAG